MNQPKYPYYSSSSLAIQYTYNETVMNVASYGNEGQNPYTTFQRTGYTYQSFQKPMGSPFTSSTNELGSQNLNNGIMAITTEKTTDLLISKSLEVSTFSNTTTNRAAKAEMIINEFGEFTGATYSLGLNKMKIDNNGSLSYGNSFVLLGIDTYGSLTMEMSVPTSSNSSIGLNLKIDKQTAITIGAVIFVISTRGACAPVLIPVFK